MYIVYRTYYRAKATGSVKFGNLTTYSVAYHIPDPPKMANLNNKQSLYNFAKYVKGTLENYFASTDRVISRNHIPRFHHSDSVRVITAMLDSTVESEVYVMYRIVGNIRGRKLSRIIGNEKFVEKTFVDR